MKDGQSAYTNKIWFAKSQRTVEGTRRRKWKRKPALKKNKKEAKENSPQLAETLEAVTKLLGNNQGRKQ